MTLMYIAWLCINMIKHVVYVCIHIRTYERSLGPFLHQRTDTTGLGGRGGALSVIKRNPSNDGMTEWVSCHRHGGQCSLFLEWIAGGWEIPVSQVLVWQSLKDDGRQWQCFPPNQGKKYDLDHIHYVNMRQHPLSSRNADWPETRGLRCRPGTGTGSAPAPRTAKNIDNRHRLVSAGLPDRCFSLQRKTTNRAVNGSC